MTGGGILGELLLPHFGRWSGGCRREEEERDVEVVEMGVKEVEKDGEDGGDMKVEEEEQMIENHLEFEKS